MADPTLTSVDDHLKRILSVVRPMEALDLRLMDAHGCVLAEDVAARSPLPGFDNSSMDGYAVRVEDVRSASEGKPVRLAVVGDIAAGSAEAITVQPGFTARIMTGAPMPPGADAVVPLEWTDGGTRAVRISRAPQPGQHVRRQGDDVPAGQLVMRNGTRIGPAQLGLLAAVGRSRVRARPRPRVVVISTGSELVDPGTALGTGKIVDSNSYMLTAAAIDVGAIAYRVGIVPDDPRTLLHALEDHLIRADAVVTSGGVSVGAYDVVKEVLSRMGTVTFDRLAMQPGMPQGFGVLGGNDTPIFGLPGNPVSAYVSFEAFVRPALLRMLGASSLSRPQISARLSGTLSSPAGKRQFARGRVEYTEDGPVVTPIGGPGSHLLASLASANALIVVPEDRTEIAPDEQVTVMVLEQRLI
ncbi:MAG: molybdopterin molybdotransferase MoeA [Actinomycetota bacterium]|nr:molybdopterin molybdotransferase MoeA [Actinomycetota bacterium]